MPPKVVQLGSIIVFDKVQPDPVPVIWQQNFVKRTKYFHFILFKVKANGSGGYLAVEDAYWDQFQRMVEDSPTPDDGWKRAANKGQLTVTRDFRYGQNKEQTFRFLVLGDKADNMYQHRFAKAFNNFNSSDEFQTFARTVGAFIEGFLKSSVVTDVAETYIGDPLREF